MTIVDRILTRAAGYTITPVKPWKPSLGNLKPAGGGSRRGRGVAAATTGVTYVSEGQPLRVEWDAQTAIDTYHSNVWVMQCCRVIANTIAELPWVAGMDPTTPATYTPAAPLAKFLGPSTPMAPGGPNPQTSARAFWAWSIVQYLVTGRFAWEAQLTGTAKHAPIVALWPLASHCLFPKPSFGGSRWFDGFQYQPATGVITLANDQVVYCWRASQHDWRQPESALQAARLPSYILTSIDKYMAGLMQRDMVATTLVISPPFDQPAQRRAWQEQFLAEFTGVDRAGSTIFGEFEIGETTPAGRGAVQVEKIATTPRDAQVTVIRTQMQVTISIALGVPKSILGDASARTYDNASMEYKNFWTITVLPLLSELQDEINNKLAPRVGTEVGWFDLSRVEALKPPEIFAPPTITAVIATGVATPQQVQNILNLPALTPAADVNTTTAPLDVEATMGGGMGAGMGAYATASPVEVRRAQWWDRKMASLTLERRTLVRTWLQEAAFRQGRYWQGWPDVVNTTTLKGLHKRAEDAKKPLRIVEVRSWKSKCGPGIEAGSKIAQRAHELKALNAARRKIEPVVEIRADDAEWLDQFGDALEAELSA